MKTANVVFRLTKDHEVPLTGVTPAELLMLVAEHKGLSGGEPVASLTDEKDVQRSTSEEIIRLKNRFGKVKVEHFFQGAIPNLPTTFDEAKSLGLGIEVVPEKLTLPPAKTATPTTK